jgi:hypothetical protein
MTASHPKRPRDPNQLAKSIIDIAAGQKPDGDPTLRPSNASQVRQCKRLSWPSAGRLKG